MNIQDVVAKIKSGELKAEQLVSEHIQKAKTIGAELNAFITVVDEAVERAREIDQRIAEGKAVGRLAGIPCTIKDVIMTEGVQTTAGSRILEGFIAPYSATVVQRLEAEDAVIIGKTNCDPFAFGGSGENSGYGPTKNPIDHSRVPGGSSSGAAASIAAEIGLFAIGTDTGGSVRQPASFTGVVGFKPTYGRNSRYGLMAMASSFDTPGIFAHSIEDAALVEEIIAGKDGNDATTYDVVVPNYLRSLDELDIANLRVGVPKEFFAQGLDPEVEQVVKAAISELQKRGAQIIDISIPTLKYGIAVYYVLVPSEISSNMARYNGVRYGRKVSDEFVENMMGSRGEFLEAEVKRRIMIGTYALSAGYADQYYKKATKVRVKLTREVQEVFKQVDVIVGPTAPTTAFKIGERTEDPVQMYLADVYTVIANLVGMPAISVPVGKSASGLPIGLQLMTDRFEEEKLFQAANQVEKITIK